jgi:hypothetical protein
MLNNDLFSFLFLIKNTDLKYKIIKENALCLQLPLKLCTVFFLFFLTSEIDVYIYKYLCKIKNSKTV